METLTTFTHFEKTIINNIDLTPYDMINEVDLFSKIKTVYDIFKSEYVHNNNRQQNETKLFGEWLQGLPSVLTIPFYNGEILQNAEKNGFNFPTELMEDIFLNDYFFNCAAAFFTLKNNL